MNSYRHLFLALALAGSSVTVAWAQQTGKPIYQQTDAAAPYYLSNRAALVGHGVAENSLSAAITLGEWVENPENLTDENLDNYVTFTSGVEASIAVNPIVGVRDKKRHYAAGTPAGFRVMASSDSKLLSLDVIKLYSVVFYCEGKLVGTVACGSSKEGGLLGLGLLSFSTGDAAIDLVATAPAEFDEIHLMPAGGVDLTAVTSMKVQYGFVGAPHTYTLTNQGAGKTGGIEEYCADYDRSLTLYATSGAVNSNSTIGNTATRLIDADLTNDGPGTVLGNMTCTITAQVKDDGDAPFKAGTSVGFHYKAGSVLNLDLGSTSVIQLLDADGNKLQEEHLNTKVLGLGLASGGEGDFVIKAAQDFHSAKLVFGGVSVDVGSTVVNYFYVTPEADAVGAMLGGFVPAGEGTQYVLRQKESGLYVNFDPTVSETNAINVTTLSANPTPFTVTRTDDDENGTATYAFYSEARGEYLLPESSTISWNPSHSTEAGAGWQILEAEGGAYYLSKDGHLAFANDHPAEGAYVYNNIAPNEYGLFEIVDVATLPEQTFTVSIGGREDVDIVIDGKAYVDGSTLSAAYIDPTKIMPQEKEGYDAQVSVEGTSIKVTYTPKPIATPEDIDPAKTYVIYTEKRGGLSVNEEGTQAVSTKQAGQQVDASNEAQQFAFVTVGEETYLYSVKTEKFVNADGTLSPIPYDAVSFADDADGTMRIVIGTKNVNLNNVSNLSLDNWTTKDDGNSFSIQPAGDFDATGVINRLDALQPAATPEDISADKAYIIYTTERGGLTVNAEGTNLVSTKQAGQKANGSNEAQYFAFVDIDGTKYLYSVEAQKFVNADGKLSPLPVDPVSFANAEDGTMRLVIGDASNGNVNLNGESNLAINNWTTKDAGNSFIIQAVDDFDANDVYDRLNDVREVTYEYYIGEDLYKTVTEQLPVGTTVEAPEVLPFTTITSSDLEEGATVADNTTVRVNIEPALPFATSSEGDDEVSGYLFAHANQTRYAFAKKVVDAETSAESWVPADDNNSRPESLDDSYLWTISGNLIDGFTVRNAEGGYLLATADGLTFTNEESATRFTLATAQQNGFGKLNASADAIKAKAFALYCEEFGYVNAQGNLAFWNKNDAGSTFLFAIPGDIDLDGDFDLDDVTALADHVDHARPCYQGDLNGDGRTSIGDVSHLIRFISK